MTKSSKGAVLAPTPPPALSSVADPALLVSMDCGNGAIKVYDGSHHSIIQSLYAPIPTGAETVSGPGARYQKNSPVVSLDGKLYHVGQMAGHYNSHKLVAVGDKAQLIRLLVAAGLPVSPGHSQVNLVLCHHSSSVVQSQLRSALLGELKFRRNGKDHTVNIRSVEVLDECYGSWYFSKHQGLLGQRLTLGLDLGCGTAVARLIDTNGVIIKSLTDSNSGVLGLAYLIAQNKQLQLPLWEKLKITHPTAASILRGLEDGSHRYECTGISWKDWWEPVRGQWFKDFLEYAMREFRQQIPQVDRFMVTGGGAHLVSDLVEKFPRFMVPTLPHLANAIGGWQWANAQRLAGGN